LPDHLPGWKADLLNCAGRKVLVRYVLTSMLVYLAMTSELPPWVIKEIEEIWRRFLWRGKKEVTVWLHG
jgi:hypothetical protein